MKKFLAVLFSALLLCTCGAILSACDKAIYTQGIIYDYSGNRTYAMVVGYEGSLTEINIAPTYNNLPVKSIYDSAFKNAKITKVIIPDSVTSIGPYAFSSCASLTSIEIPNSVTYIGSAAFNSCSSLTSIEIPDGVTSIEKYAFSNCTSLTSIEIPNSVTSIGDYAFEYCRSLTSIAFNGTISEWNNISEGSGWKSGVPATYVQCLDGRVELD